MSPASIIQPLLFAALMWWGSTGAILLLDQRPRQSYGRSFALASALAICAGIFLGEAASRTDAVSSYVAFSSALALWGWHEMSFLMGFITGPRRLPLPQGTRGWVRFKLAAATIIYHELAVALTALVLVVLCWGQANQFGVITFVSLWALRLSAKLNLYFGAPYRSEEMLPSHLAHLASYFRHRRMNALAPFSLLAGGISAWAFAVRALAPDANAFTQSGNWLVFGIISLGIIEHVFLFAPPPTRALWGWAMARRRGVTSSR